MANQQESMQAVVLQQPNGQKLFLDIQHSTDWVVAASIICSVFISFIGFLITIYVVRKSTESQIKSNQELIQSQEKQNKIETAIHLSKEKIDAIRLASADFISLYENLLYESKNLQNNLDIDYPIEYVVDLTKKRDLMESLGTKLELYIGNSTPEEKLIRADIILFKRRTISNITPSFRKEKIEINLSDLKEEVRLFKEKIFKFLNSELTKVKEGV